MKSRRSEEVASSQVVARDDAKDVEMIRAHGVELGRASEHEIFLSANFTLVETHKGSDTRLNCRVKRGSDYGTVRIQCSF